MFLADSSLGAGWRDLAFLGGLDALPGIAVAEHLASFLATYAAERKPRRVLDPFAGSPIVAAAVAEAVPGAEIVAVSPSSATIEHGRLLAPEVDWQLSDSLDFLDGEERFDLIVGVPPIGIPVRGKVLPGAPGVFPTGLSRLQRQYVVLAAVADRLTGDGRIALDFSDHLFYSRDGEILREWLAERGVFLEASLSVPGGRPQAQIESQVSIFGRRHFGDLFVARVTRVTPATAVGEILANLLGRARGAARELGFIADPREYRGWQSEMARLELDQALADSPRVARLQELALSIERVELRRGQPWPGRGNTIFFPEAGLGPVRTRVDWSAKGEKRNLIAVELDPTRVDAEFLVSWLNGPGGFFRQAYGTGVVPRVSRRDLSTMRVPLPPLGAQVRNTELRNRIAGLGSQLALLSGRLASAFTDLDLADAKAELAALIGDDERDSWIARLPFPMAAVLRRYYAEREPHKRLAHLLHFFEVGAAFSAILLLSAVHTDPVNWEVAKGKLARCGEGGQSPLRRPGFGTWVRIARTLANVLRRDLERDDDDTRLRLLGVSDPTFATDLVLDKGLWELFQAAAEVRNREAHGGGVSDLQVEATLRELAEFLGELHQRFGGTFDQVRLVQPGLSSFERGVHTYGKARLLRGADPVFMGCELVSIVPLNHDSLYLVDADATLETALELLPLARLLSLPDGSSDFFVLNRVGADGGLQFVSHYYLGPIPDPITDPELADLVDELKPDGD